MPRVRVKCTGCGCHYDRYISDSYHPKTHFCSRACRTKHRLTKLTSTQEAIYKLIKDNEGISTYEIVKLLKINYTRCRVAATKLWTLGLVGKLYNTWSAEKEGAEEEWKR